MRITPLEFRFLRHDIEEPSRLAHSFIQLALKTKTNSLSKEAEHHLEAAERDAKALTPVREKLNEIAERQLMLAGNEAPRVDEPGAWEKNLDEFHRLARQMHAHVRKAYQCHQARVGQDETLDEFMNYIHDGTYQLHQGVTSLSGRQNRFSLRTLIAQSIPALKRTGMSVTHSLPQTPIWIKANPVALQRILINLARNASLRGKAKSLHIETLKRDGKLLLRVSNDGKPISSEVRPKIFDLSFSTAGSSGLGLTLSRQAARRHGGDLRLLESVPGRTTFELELPRSRQMKPRKAKIRLLPRKSPIRPIRTARMPR